MDREKFRALTGKERNAREGEGFMSRVDVSKKVQPGKINSPSVTTVLEILEQVWKQGTDSAKVFYDEPLDGLIETVLSQNTNDRNRDMAFERLTAKGSWDAIAGMPKEMIAMAQRMKNMTPKLLTADADAPVIDIAVDNNILLDQINSIQKRIKATLAKRLQNGNIELKIRLSETGEIKPILTKRQIFDLIRRNNPAIEKLRTSLELQLS